MNFTPNVLNICRAMNELEPGELETVLQYGQFRMAYTAGKANITEFWNQVEQASMISGGDDVIAKIGQDKEAGSDSGVLVGQPSED